MTWVNYKEIKTRVRIEQVLERYGVLGELREKGDSLVGRCPIHKGSNANQFHVSRQKNNFMCFSDCHEGGNVIDFVVMMEGGDKRSGDDVRRAAARLQEWFGLAFERPQGGRRRTAAPVSASAVATAFATMTDTAQGVPAASQPALPLAGSRAEPPPAREPDPAPERRDARTEPDAPEADVDSPSEPSSSIYMQPNPPLKFALKSLNSEHPYLTGRGLPTDTLEYFGVGMFTGKGIMAGRIAIPIHNEDGALIGYAGRWPGEPPEGEGKYKLPTGFHKSLVVYNLHRAKEHAKEAGLVVVEGFFDAMRLHASGFPNVVALMGSAMSEAQEELIVTTVGPEGKVTLMFDEDDAGWKGREDARSRLSSRVYVKVIGLGEEGRQPDSMGKDELTRAMRGI